MRTIDASLATWMGAHSRVPGLLAATGAQAKGLPASSPTPPPAAPPTSPPPNAPSSPASP
jgi:hypothetical protein